eukprot:TRINITY_DN19352_c0_g1_i1.p1 TRINITY_DN19352_c0_g1~~TRINITY_DN19352_c0_g1_i1.p1  ORF type:complete len:305 (-),score=41.79 TRINITY_DN19352_c0_g1_i1:8-901(-)
MAARCVEVFVLGSGCSEGVPRVSCLVGGQCSVCLDAARKDVRSPNLRRPPALLLRFDRPEDQSRKYNVLIDCGKFFWQAALEWFPKLRVDSLDAVVLTHSHNDAAYGLDDLRDLTREKKEALPVYHRAVDRPVLQAAFPYLFTLPTIGGGVSNLDFREFSPLEPFEPVPGLKLVPLPLEHGADGCCGFRFGGVSYVSDAVAIPPQTLALINGSEVVLMDALYSLQCPLSVTHTSHFTVRQALAALRTIVPPPQKCFLVGMNHTVDHNKETELLQSETKDDPYSVVPAFDGMELTTNV